MGHSVQSPPPNPDGRTLRLSVAFALPPFQESVHGDDAWTTSSNGTRQGSCECAEARRHVRRGFLHADSRSRSFGRRRTLSAPGDVSSGAPLGGSILRASAPDAARFSTAGDSTRAEAI